jgi:hypothetical protein
VRSTDEAHAGIELAAEGNRRRSVIPRDGSASRRGDNTEVPLA